MCIRDSTNTGDRSAATNTGNQSAATNTGDWSAATVTGENSVAVNIGVAGKVKGALGCGIVLCEYDESRNLICIKSALVDGTKIKPDTFYTLKNGKFVECE